VSVIATSSCAFSKHKAVSRRTVGRRKAIDFAQALAQFLAGPFSRLAAGAAAENVGTMTRALEAAQAVVRSTYITTRHVCSAWAGVTEAL
jgi:hypothetical protein